MLTKNVLEDFTNPVSEHDKLQNDDHDQDIFFEYSEGFDIGMDNTCNQEKTKANNDEDAGIEYGDSDYLRSMTSR